MPTDEFDSLTGHAARHDALDAAVAAPTFVSATAPVDPAEGATWLDTSVTPNVLKVWVDGSPGEWVGAGGGGGGDASSIDYDNTTSGLVATDVQGAIDALAAVSGDFTFADTRFSWYGFQGNVLGVPPFPNGSGIASGNTGGATNPSYPFSVGISSSASANSGYALTSNNTRFSTGSCQRVLIITNTTATDRVIRIGLSVGSTLAAEPPDGFYVLFQDSGTAILRARASSVSTDSATGYTFAADTAYLVDLIVLSSTSVRATIRSINGTELWEETLTSGLPPDTTVMRWHYAAWRITGGSNADVCWFGGHGIGPTVPSWMAS